jgi:hypothetical protein
MAVGNQESAFVGKESSTIMDGWLLCDREDISIPFTTLFSIDKCSEYHYEYYARMPQDMNAQDRFQDIRPITATYKT